MKTQFAAATAVLLGASLITAPGAFATPGDTVEYTVTSDAPLKFVSYYDAAGTLVTVADQPAPWSVSFTSKDASSSAAFSVSANPTGQKTTCTITVNGSVKDTQTKTGSGDANTVTCITG